MKQHRMRFFHVVLEALQEKPQTPAQIASIWGVHQAQVYRDFSAVPQGLEELKSHSPEAYAALELAAYAYSLFKEGASIELVFEGGDDGSQRVSKFDGGFDDGSDVPDEESTTSDASSNVMVNTDQPANQRRIPNYSRIL